jgi:hypothetical protein
MALVGFPITHQDFAGRLLPSGYLPPPTAPSAICLPWLFPRDNSSNTELLWTALHWLNSAWSVNWYSLQALRADSLKTPLATPLVLLRLVHHHHPATSYKHLPYKTVSYCCVIAWLLSTITVVWHHLCIWCIALRHMFMRGHEGNASTVLLHGTCARTRPAVCRPGMPWANPSQYYKGWIKSSVNTSIVLKWIYYLR